MTSDTAYEISNAGDVRIYRDRSKAEAAVAGIIASQGNDYGIGVTILSRLPGWPLDLRYRCSPDAFLAGTEDEDI